MKHKYNKYMTLFLKPLENITKYLLLKFYMMRNILFKTKTCKRNEYYNNTYKFFIAYKKDRFVSAP